LRLIPARIRLTAQVFDKGDEADSFYLVINGRVSAHHQAQHQLAKRAQRAHHRHQHVCVASFGSGDVFGVPSLTAGTRGWRAITSAEASLMRVPRDVYESYRELFTRLFELSASDQTCIAAAEMPHDHMIDEHSAVLEGRLALMPCMLPLSSRRVSALSKRLSIRKVTSGEIIALEGFPARSFFISLDAELLTYRGLDPSVARAFKLSQGERIPSVHPHSIEGWVEMSLLLDPGMVSESGESKRVHAAVACDGTFTIDSRGPGGGGSGGDAGVSSVDDRGGKEECEKGEGRGTISGSQGDDDEGKSKKKEDDVAALTFRFSLRKDLRSVEVRIAPMHTNTELYT
jgi:CRP-like cAMP-binding protein